MIVKVNNPFNLAIASGKAFHHRRRFEPTGCHPMVSIPQPTQCLIARLLHSSWMLSTIEGSDPAPLIEFRAPDNHNFIGVKLADDERLVFNFHYFVGFTGGLKLHTHLTLNLGSLTLPRILFQMARGSGLLLLQARGVPRIWERATDVPAFSPSRLICWSADSQFDLQGSARTADIFLSPIYLKAHHLDLLVIDADEPGKHHASHIWPMLKRFWKPF